MGKKKAFICAMAIIASIFTFAFVAVNIGNFVLERAFHGMLQKGEEEYKETHILLPADGLVVGKNYVAQHTDYTYTLFFSNSTTYPESYIITLQRTYKGKKITGDYTATEDEYQTAKKGAMFRDPVGSNMWYDLSSSSK